MQKIHVLLVDDQSVVRNAIARLIEGEGDLVLHYCQDPIAALATAERVGPSVILQDLEMPDIDGLALVDRYRRSEKLKDVPLIILSTRDDARDKEEAFARGVNDFLLKLPHKRELVARLRYHAAAYAHLRERQEIMRKLEVRNQFIRSTFGRYLSDEIAETLLENPEGLRLGGEKRKVTILMADLRGFTAMSETLAPEIVVALINNFLDVMTTVILARGGTIDEFIGDAILVVFGAPVQRPDDADRAVMCAVEMQLGMTEVHERNRRDGLPLVNMGIGVHTGDAVAGNIGSKQRAKYGVVGATVNLASRIENCSVGGQILISGSTREAVSVPLRIDGEMEVMLKGWSKATQIFEIGGAAGLERPVVDTRVVLLRTPLEVSFQMLINNLAETPMDGKIVRLSEIEAELVAERVPRVFTDVYIVTPGGGVYGKVMPRAPVDKPGFVVRFTSVGEAAGRYLDEQRK